MPDSIHKRLIRWQGETFDFSLSVFWKKSCSDSMCSANVNLSERQERKKALTESKNSLQTKCRLYDLYRQREAYRVNKTGQKWSLDATIVTHSLAYNITHERMCIVKFFQASNNSLLNLQWAWHMHWSCDQKYLTCWNGMASFIIHTVRYPCLCYSNNAHTTAVPQWASPVFTSL